MGVKLLVNFLLTAAGFALLIKCADFFVDGASSLARNFKISTTVIGLTVVAFGTSAPELAISFNAHASGNTDILFGNVIGSNTANILLILGIAILIKPFKIENAVIRKEIPILLLITLGFSVIFLDSLFEPVELNSLGRADAIVLMLFFAVFVFYLITLLSGGSEGKGGEDIHKAPKHKLAMSIVLTVLGLAGVVIGSDLIVNNLSALAAYAGISQKVISVTVISIGTSLPELVTTVVAAKKGENNMAIGNIVGSNIFNICIVLGLPVLLLGEAATVSFHIADIIFLVLSVVLLWKFAASGREVKRYEALIMIAVYGIYGAYILL